MLDANNINTTRRKLADCCIKGEYTEAMRLSEQLFAYYRSAKSTTSAAYGEDLFNTAFAYENVGEHKKAIRLYTESSRVAMEIDGENSDFFYCLVNIAVIYCKTGECAVALELFSSIINGIKRKKVDDDNLKFLCYYNVGSALCTLERYEDGIVNLRKARRYCKHNVDSNYFDVLYSLGLACQEKGEYKSSSLYFIEAAKAIRQAEPQNLAEYINVLVSLSEVYEKMGAYGKSIDRLLETLRIMDNLFIKGNRAYTSIQTRLASLYLKSGMHDKAIEICSNTAENIKKLIGESSFQYANALRDMALICKEAGQYEKGIKCLKDSIKIKTTLLGENSRECIKDTITLISFLVEMKELKKALDLLIKTLNAMDSNESGLDEFMPKLAELYLSLGEVGNLHNVHSRAVELEKQADDDELF